MNLFHSIPDRSPPPRGPRLNWLEQRLVNDYQHDFPLSRRPFADIGDELGVSEAAVIRALDDLQAGGVVSRVGPVFRPNTVGASTLAAMAVPAGRLEEVAALVNAYEEVNHNYEREHRFNLWFVVTAVHQARVAEVLAEIEECTGLPVMMLPMVRDYHIDLGFDMSGAGARADIVRISTWLRDKTRVLGQRGGYPVNWSAGCRRRVGELLERRADDAEPGLSRDVVAATQGGLPLVSEPYRAAARSRGLTEDDLLRQLIRMLALGSVHRLGVVVRHRELGYRANAMVVWDVPDARVVAAARRMAALPQVTLCYQRPRRLPEWPYNLFCMIHGLDRDTVLEAVDTVAFHCGLSDCARAPLFSRRRFKQRGARYVPPPPRV